MALLEDKAPLFALPPKLQLQSPLFQLPQELRTEVYNHLFDMTALRFLFNDDVQGVADPDEDPAPLKPNATALAILHTCRRARDEIGLSWFPRVLLHFECPKDMMTVLTSGLPRPLRYTDVRHVRLGAGCAMLFTRHREMADLNDLLRFLPGLQLDTLTVWTASLDVVWSLLARPGGWRKLTVVGRAWRGVSDTVYPYRWRRRWPTPENGLFSASVQFPSPRTPPEIELWRAEIDGQGPTYGYGHELGYLPGGEPIEGEPIEGEPIEDEEGESASAGAAAAAAAAAANPSPSTSGVLIRAFHAPGRVDRAELDGMGRDELARVFCVELSTGETVSDDGWYSFFGEPWRHPEICLTFERGGDSQDYAVPVDLNPHEKDIVVWTDPGTTWANLRRLCTTHRLK